MFLVICGTPYIALLYMRNEAIYQISSMGGSHITLYVFVFSFFFKCPPFWKFLIDVLQPAKILA